MGRPPPSVSLTKHLTLYICCRQNSGLCLDITYICSEAGAIAHCPWLRSRTVGRDHGCLSLFGTDIDLTVSLSLSLSLSLYLSVCLSFCMSVCLSVCLPVCLSHSLSGLVLVYHFYIYSEASRKLSLIALHSAAGVPPILASRPPAPPPTPPTV